MIKNVIWDLSGTLFRPQKIGLSAQEIEDYSFVFLMWSGKKDPSPLDEICFKVLDQLGEQTGPKDLIARLHTGKPLPDILVSYLDGTVNSQEALEKTMNFFDEWAPKHLKQEDQTAVKRKLNTFFNPASLAICMKPIETATHLMQRTAQKSPLYILSNWDADSFIPFYKRFGNTILEPFNKQHIVISASTGYVKPQLSIYEYFLAIHKLNPSECFFIDDQEENVIAAQELGIAAWEFQEQHVHDLEEYLKQMHLV